MAAKDSSKQTLAEMLNDPVRASFFKEFLEKELPEQEKEKGLLPSNDLKKLPN